jgi:hypothetical protein
MRLVQALGKLSLSRQTARRTARPGLALPLRTGLLTLVIIGGEYLSSGPFRQVRRLDNALFNEVIVLTLPSLTWVRTPRLSAVIVMESSFRRQLMHTLIALAGGL